GVVRQPRVDLQRDPTVDLAGALVDVAEHVGGIAHVVGGDLADGLVHAGAAGRQLVDLVRVVRCVGHGGGEDRRVAGHTDHVVVGDQLGEVAGVDPLSGQVVQPDRHPCFAQRPEVRVCAHGIPSAHALPDAVFRLRRAASTTASAVNPNSLNSVL